jgi:hypothetical protein
LKRSFERSTELPAFKCDLPAFESLVDEMRGSLVPEQTSLLLSISSRSGEQIDFENFDEFRSAPGLPATINRISVQLYEPLGNRRWSFVAAGRAARVRVNGDSAAWCAGLEERTVDFANRHRVWARSFIQSGSMVALGALAAFSYTEVGKGIKWPWTLGPGIAAAIAAYLFFSRNRFFPEFTLELRREESSWTRRGPTVALVAGIIAAIAAIVQIILMVLLRTS